MRRLLAGAAVATLVAACSSSSHKTATTASTASTTTVSNQSTSVTPADWLTYDYDNTRSGVTPDQAPMGRVVKLWQSASLDGDVYAQPLLLGNQVIVATENNSVYAFDAPSGRQLWRVHLGTPVSGGSLPCGNIDPSGITGTPVASTSVLYVVAFLADGARHELFALDRTGAVKWHRAIDPPGLSGRVEQERGALALSGGRVLVPFGGLFGDCGPYKGAVVSVPADGSAGMQSYVVPTSREAGIWNPAGETVDASGNVWVNTGNSASESTFDYGNAVIKLDSTLQSVDFFAPREWARLNDGDVDLGSTSPVLVGDQRVVAVGKSGMAYLLDRAHLGGIGGSLTQTTACGAAFGQPAVQGRRVFIPCIDGLLAVDTSGDRLATAWRASGAAGPPIVAGGAVWVLFGSGQLEALDPATGRQRFSTSVGQPASRFVSMAAGGGRLFVAPTDSVTAFALR